MTGQETGSFVFTVCLLLLAVHALGFLFEKLKQPKLIGEILAGIILGPFILGPWLPELGSSSKILLDFLSQAGLLLLMFLAGSEARQLGFTRHRKIMLSLLTIGTGLPFVLIMLAGGLGVLTVQSIQGSAQSFEATLLVLAIAVTVTSIPVLSRIFQDLKLLHTRFAGLIIGTAVLEDILLWGILSLAQVLASGKTAPIDVMIHTAMNLSFMAMGLLVFPKILAGLPEARANIITRNSPTAWPILILLIYVSIAHLINVNVVFAAFLAGFGVIGGAEAPARKKLADSLDAIGTVARAFFIPLFFAMVGHKLIFGIGFNWREFLTFLLLSSLLSIISSWIAARIGGMKNYEAINIAITNNARGGPGIVLAGIAYESGLVTASFYTTLVITAIITSQWAALWLKLQIKKGRPLLENDVL